MRVSSRLHIYEAVANFWIKLSPSASLARHSFTWRDQKLCRGINLLFCDCLCACERLGVFLWLVVCMCAYARVCMCVYGGGLGWIGRSKGLFVCLFL